MRILLFGTGDYYQRYKKWFEGQDVLALLDNSAQKKYTVIDGRKVLPPEEGIRLEYDVIVILSFYVRQMKEQLISLGVDPGKILHFYGLHRSIGPGAPRRPVRSYGGAAEAIGPARAGRPLILLLSHDLTLGGPAIALYHAARVLVGNGYEAVVASMLDGPLREVFIRDGIPVIVDENLQIATMQETGWVHASSLILCNTMNFHVFLSDRDTGIPVIWWLHDARFFYDGVDRDVIGRICLHHLTAVSVGPVPAKALQEFLPALECGELLYGVEDAASDVLSHEHPDKVRFTVIGFLEERKGQDILLEAVRLLPDHIRRRCVFHLVGHADTLFGERLRRECEGMEEIVFTGTLGREDIHKMLRKSDVLVCPSRQDPMPTVAAEAMMHSVPCIVSDATGTAAYIHDGVDGSVFPCGDARALAGEIGWCARNRDRLDSMGAKARLLYERHFSMPVFEERLLGVVREALGQQ